MDGQIDWQALPVLCEIYGIDDPEKIVRDLITVREHFKRLQEVK